MMREYLADDHFGQLAAHVLSDQWRTANEPPKDKRLLGGVDFSGVAEKRATRATDPDATSAEAEIIFAAIEPLIADTATDEQRKLAVALGTVASRLPHGQRDRVIQKLIALAPRRARTDLLMNLVLSGEEIDIKVVADGIAETIEAARKDPWILTQSDGYELRVWLRLLPFVSTPTEALAVVHDMPFGATQTALFGGNGRGSRRHSLGRSGGSTVQARRRRSALLSKLPLARDRPAARHALLSAPHR
jgi:hypothetical protein